MRGDTEKLRILDLFSGIGGFSLGLERTGGFETVAFCEIDEWCRGELARNWPDVPAYEDVTRFDGRAIGHVDVITGGFPCQDISHANTNAKGIDGERSGLVFEMLRIIREARPSWVVFENSPALRVRGADRVLDEMEAQGYACWPLVVGARHVLAPHRRDRVWIVAYTDQPVTERRREMGRRGWCAADVEGNGPTSSPHADEHSRQQSESQAIERYVPGGDGEAGFVSAPHAHIPRHAQRQSESQDARSESPPAERSVASGQVTDPLSQRIRQQPGWRSREGGREASLTPLHADPHIERQPQQPVGQVGGSESIAGFDGEPWGWWNGGPGTHLRVDDGLSVGVARRWLKAYGNSVVPAIVEMIGRAILRT